MKKGICIGSLPGSSAEARFTLAKEAGFEGVEINTLDNDNDRQEIKAVAEEHDLEVISVMNSKHWACPLSDADAQIRAESRAGMLDSIATAKAVGAETVLLVPAVVNDKTSYEDAYQRSQAEIRKLIPAAKDNEITIALENVWNKFLLSPIEFCRYVDEFDSETVTAYFDVGNIVLYGYPQQWIRSLGKRIAKVHVKGFNANESRFTYLIEDCTINWNAVMSALADVRYDDYMTAELPVDRDNPESRVHSISEDMDRIIAGTV
ncbi:sugar phosphate isomerase/epimerase [Candidatus Poribacteria bacterium]|nr:sugar phosphate isomerase/epimerase [Candidatus Poribacteria bacterium]